jgi:hypothetical protein
MGQGIVITFRIPPVSFGFADPLGGESYGDLGGEDDEDDESLLSLLFSEFVADMEESRRRL